MDPEHKQVIKDLRHRTTSLLNSAVSLQSFLLSLKQTSGLSPQLQLAVEATSDFLLLMTEALRVLQLDMARSNWTDVSTQLQNWREHWHIAYANFESQIMLDSSPELFDY